MTPNSQPTLGQIANALVDLSLADDNEITTAALALTHDLPTEGICPEILKAVRTFIGVPSGERKSLSRKLSEQRLVTGSSDRIMAVVLHIYKLLGDARRSVLPISEQSLG